MPRSKSPIVLVKELKGDNLVSFSGIFARLMWLNTPDTDVSGKQSLLELKGMSHLIFAALILVS